MSLFVATSARAELGVEPELVDSRGRIVIPGFTVARRLASSLSRASDQEGDASAPVTAGDLVAVAIIDDVYRALLTSYLGQRDANTLSRALEHLADSLGPAETVELIGSFRGAFGLRAESGDQLGAQQVERESTGLPAIDESLVLEVVLFWLQLRNPAAGRVVSGLHRGFSISPAMRKLLAEIETFLEACEGLSGRSLAEDLLAPISANPNSLAAQLEFLKRAWSGMLGEELWRIQSALDLIAEETAPRWGPGGEPPVEAPGLPVDGEVQYAADRAWMPRLVLAAKNTLVWLNQLSKAYDREITRLDQIPEAELELLAGRGLTGLWLIGIWERSLASSEIKRRRGNPEAAASAYSLRDYRIADEFGGEEALETLRRRAERHGVRLAADMVPNHMGIDSDWVLDHPGRFVQVEHPPYPAYSFDGPDLSPRQDVGIFLEDHYYDGTDAAVVFKRVDRTTGEETFIYHGNDGTSMPWNDTAQLDYLNAGVREAVIETILEVAKRFSVIRFDAAMTLAKRHYHRLWHPQAGDAGAIPSRSEHGLSRQELDRHMPREFWREVVDRVAAEAPDTLLLAEAFWLMEGYFVRTLGLHRVYNSAFMHMMRDRETGKYRRLIKETLAFDPEILRRYVNFMSNPDEESAADQFDLGDRYFGACTVLATLPGLPMFAHGQWDGLREKYGMEYRRSYRNEAPLPQVIERHDREIAPLLRRRARFADVESFRLYDFVDEAGTIREEVLAYSNGRGSDANLVVFNNSPDPVRGRLSGSAPYRPRENRDVQTEWIGDALPLISTDSSVVVLRDSVRNLSVLSSIRKGGESGLVLDVGPFAALVFDRFDQKDDGDGSWLALTGDLQGRPVSDPHLELAVFRAATLSAAITRLADALGTTENLDRSGGRDAGSGEPAPLVAEVAEELDRELQAYLSGPPFDAEAAGSSSNMAASDVVRYLTGLGRRAGGGAGRISLEKAELRHFVAFLPLMSELRTRPIASGLGERLLDRLAANARIDDRQRADLASALVLAAREAWLDSPMPPGVRDLAAMAKSWTEDGSGRSLLRVHDAEGEEWIVSEGLEALLALRTVAAALSPPPGEDESDPVDGLMARVGWRLAAAALGRTAKLAGYRPDRWRETLRRLAASQATARR